MYQGYGRQFLEELLRVNGLISLSKQNVWGNLAYLFWLNLLQKLRLRLINLVWGLFKIFKKNGKNKSFGYLFRLYLLVKPTLRQMNNFENYLKIEWSMMTIKFCPPFWVVLAAWRSAECWGRGSWWGWALARDTGETLPGTPATPCAETGGKNKIESGRMSNIRHTISILKKVCEDVNLSLKKIRPTNKALTESCLVFL